MTILTGDSGVGKTEVLRVAQVRDEEGIGPAPSRVRNGPGALQRALLESLGEAMAELTTDESMAKRLGRLLSDTAKRVAEARLDELGAAVGQHLLSIVRNRVGDQVADLLQETARQLTTSESQQLAARIVGATIPM